MAKGRSSLGRGITWGLLGALLLGGVGLAVWGVYLSVGAPDCALLSAQECALEREVRAQNGPRLTVMGAAMAVLGVALAIYMRARDSAHEDQDKNQEAHG